MRPCAAVFLLASAFAFAQPADRLAFEVASVKPNRSGDRSSDSDWDNGRIMCVNMPLKRLIAQAYELREDQISGPDWLASERFDIAAKAPRPTRDGDLQQMLQTLLVDRFKLTGHREAKPQRVYALVIVKQGSKLKPDDASSDSSSTNGTRGTLKAQHVSMQRFADRLSRMVDLPVIDQTGMRGTYTFKLEWDPAANQLSPDAPSDSQGPSIFRAMQQQLGLRLDPRKLPVQILVIDHIERQPTEN